MPSTFGRDRALQARMTVTMLLLALVYAAFMAAIFVIGKSAVVMVVAAVVMLAIQYFAADKLALAAAGAREVEPAQAPQLHALVERLCVQADIPKPRVAIADTPVPNAFAMGRSPKAATVCATRGLLETLPPAELEAVIAHEVGHIVNRDVAIMTFASFFASLASMIVQFGMYFGGGGRDRDGASPVLLIVLVSMVVWVVSFFLMRALSRYREFAADRAAAVITGRPSALSAALMRISGQMQQIPTRDLRRAHSELNAFYIMPFASRESLMSLFSTHPSMEQRIAALSRLEQQLQSQPARTGTVAL